MNNPLFSIIIPLHNREKYIVETLVSVQQQIFRDWECIIVDDGSNDNSYKIVCDFIKDDSRFTLYKRSTNFISGGNGARNEGFLKSKGQFIIFLDSDDLIDKNKLAVHEKIFSSFKHVDISFTKWVKVNKEVILEDDDGFEDDKIYKACEILTYYGNRNSFIPIAAYCVRRELLQKSGLFLEPLKINQDGEFFIRLLLQNPFLHYSQYGLFIWRIDTDNKSSYEINITKFRHRISSYKLIEQYRVLYDEPTLDLIIENAKNYMFNSYKSKCPILINENKYFFGNQIITHQKNTSILFRIKNKLSKILDRNDKI